MGRRWYQDKNGDVSTMRLITLPAAYLGMAVIISAVVGVYLKNPDAVALAGIGAGLIATSQAAKGYQKSHEE